MGSRSSFFQSKSPQRDHVPGTQEFDVSTNTDQISQRVDPRQIDRNFIEGERLGQINIRPVVRAWRRAFKVSYHLHYLKLKRSTNTAAFVSQFIHTISYLI